MKRFVALLLSCCLLFSGCGSSGLSAVSAYTAPGGASSAAAQSAAATPTPAPTQAPPAVEEGWAPTGPVTMIVAYKEGSATDQGARLFAQYAEKALGQPIQIKNIAANSGMKGWETLANAPADGYTLGFINMPNIFTAIDNGGNFIIQDFAPICTHVVETSVVVVSADSPYTTLQDLLDANRAAGESGELLRAATNGVQASNDIGAALLAYASGGWRFKHVAYGSTGDQLRALTEGECHWSVAKISDISQMLGDAETGEGATVRPLAVFDTERLSELPDVPTLDELGIPTGWYGSTRAIAAPAGTDPIIIQYYADVFRSVMEGPACIAAHREVGLSLYYLDPDELANRIDERNRFNQSLLPKLFS